MNFISVGDLNFVGCDLKGIGYISVADAVLRCVQGIYKSQDGT